MKRLSAIEIIVKRAEGPIGLCGTQRFGGATCWEDVEGGLVRMGITAPKTGGYDKCDISVTFVQDASGEQFVYRTRYDLVHPSCDHFTSLASHTRTEWRFMAGLWRPARMSPESHQAFLRAGNVDSDAWAHRCRTYDVPGLAEQMRLAS